MVAIQRRISDVVEVISGRVSENQRLHHRRNQQTQAAAAILQHREQFLACQREDAQQALHHAIHASLLGMTARLPSASAIAISARTSVFGRMTDQTSPARNTLCSSAT